MNNKIVLKNVRLSFPNLYKKEVFNNTEGKYGGSFLIQKEDKANLKLIKNALKELKGGNPAFKDHKLSLKDGDDVEYDGYKGCYSIKATSVTRPVTVNKKKEIVAEQDEVFYAGCFVNIVVNLWGQKSYEKRINFNLFGVQFVSDGESFGVSVDADEVLNQFDDESDDEEEDEKPKKKNTDDNDDDNTVFDDSNNAKKKPKKKKVEEDDFEDFEDFE